MQDPEIEMPEIEYSPIHQMSYAVADKNKQEPYVMSTWMIGTETETRVRADTTDSDDPKGTITVPTLGTETFTKVYAEGTDSDDHKDAQLIAALGTETFTEVRSEVTDSDKDHRLFSERYAPFLGTETVTLVKNEDTDSDR